MESSISIMFHLYMAVVLFSSSSSHYSMVVVVQADSVSSLEKTRRCHDEEKAALLELKRSFPSINQCDSPSQLESWKEGGGDCCSWEGVECDEHDGDHHHVVVGLDLSGSCLYGSINSRRSNNALFTLTHLRRLDLSGNNFNYSHIPSAIGNLSSLTHLKLTESNFSGQIPQQHLLSNSSSLESLDLSDCELKGGFPVAIFHLPKLKILDLSYNPGLKGYLPNFRSGSPLQSLGLSYTSFGGVLPPSIGNLASLEVLGIGGCNFTGDLPMLLGNLTQLVHLDISGANNHFTPDTLNASSSSWIGNLTKLTYLSLDDLDLTGEIPSSLMNLTRLAHLHMSNNQLSGPIPSWLLALPQLNSIDLSHNQLSGHIPPNFNHLIQDLDLSFNNLEGSIPTNISTLRNLSTLSLQHNRLFGSVDLSFFSHLQILNELVLSHNNLSLSLKNITLKNDYCFPSLQFLELASCNLLEFPTFLQNNKNILEALDLSNNRLKGQIPTWIFSLGENSVEGLYLNLSHNLLNGFEREHSPFHPRVKIRVLDLRNNKLQGSLPIQPPYSSTFSSFLISNNNLSGEVSPLICKLKSLMHLDLSFNSFGGKLPQCLSHFSNSLLLLDLRGNKFEGNIPSAWRNGCQLRMISMSQNQLQGQLPRSLANCSLLEFIDFGSNQIFDTFPGWLVTASELSILILRSNSLHGVINDEFGFSKIQVIDLSNNNFRGKLPSMLIDASSPMRALNVSRTMEYMEQDLHPPISYVLEQFDPFDYSMTMHNKGLEMNYMKIPNIFCGIDFSSNNFEGQIPGAFGYLAGLQLLNLSRNNLSGQMPSSFSNLTNLECLDLSQNQLSGRIPTELTKLTPLSSFNVSFNNLSGPIPQGNQFCTYDSKSYEGNPGLFIETWNKQCGNARSPPQLQQLPPTACDGDDDDDDGDSEYEFRMKWIIILIGFVSGLVGGVIVGNEFTTRKHDWFVKTFARKQRG